MKQQNEQTADVAASDGRQSSAWRSPAAHLRLWPIAVVGLAIDLWSKHWAFHELDPANGMVVIPHLARFQRSLNTGALFGLGKGWTPLFILASVLALGFVLYLFVHSTRQRRSLHIALGLVLAGALGNLYDRAFEIADVVTYTAGTQPQVVVGKVLSDRGDDTPVVVGSYPDGKNPMTIPRRWKPTTRQQGVVRDFIRMEPQIRIGSLAIDVWPWVYNIADSLLVFGVGLLLLNFWWERRAARALGESGAFPPAEAAEHESGS
jgi:lipoprotein signal peptidase